MARQMRTIDGHPAPAPSEHPAEREQGSRTAAHTPARRGGWRVALFGAAFAGASFSLPVVTARAQMCPEINFECCGVNTPITTYPSVPGVTFSSCGLAGCTPLGPPRIRAIGAAPSPTRALVAERCAGTETFACICATFSTPQKFAKLQVTAYTDQFPLPTVAAFIRVTAYNASNAPIFSKTAKINPPTPGSPPEFDFYTVQIQRTQCDISRVEICNEVDSFVFAPAIDDFRWGNGSNTTPPTLQITSPPFLTCYCPNDIITITGTGCNTTDCEYSELLEVSNTNLPNSFIPLPITPNPRRTCVTASTLWQFPASLLPGNDTTYYLHLTGSNLCGAQKHAVTTIKVDRNPPVVSITCPPNGAYVANWCEPLRVAGVVNDECSVHWTIGANNGIFGTILSGPNPSATAVNLGVSALYSGGGDGPHTLWIDARDQCNRLSGASSNIIIDNTPPALAITNPAPCRCVCPGDIIPINGRAFDANMKGWELHYFDHTQSPDPWVPIVSGGLGNNVGTATTTGTFTTWTVPSSIPPCCSMLRLRAKDLTDPHPCTGKPSCNNREIYVPIKFKGCGGDFNGSGTVSVQDIFDFLAIYFAASLPCP